MRGVLIVNLGTAEAPTPKAIRAYLKEFLSDRLVIDKPARWLWWIILRTAVLPRRPKMLVPQYEHIWLEDGSPLVVHTKAQVKALQERLGDSTRVAYAMRYGRPSIWDAMEDLVQQGCRNIRVLPMFPHGSKSTTGTARLEIDRVLNRMSAPPTVSIVEPFYDHPAFIAAVAGRVREAALRTKPDHYLFSYHGLPVRFVTEGDPYQQHCEATTRALVEALDLSPPQYTHAYQSRFGREPWLDPETAKVLISLARTHKRVLTVCPGFPADCLETVEEIGGLGRTSFKDHGGEDLFLVEGLNAHPTWIDAMQALLS